MNDMAKKGKPLAEAWLVILLALLYGSALAGVHVGLSEQIAENVRNETYDQIPQLIQGAVKEHIQEHQIPGVDGQLSTVYEICDDDGDCIGWVLSGSGLGFADRIDLLVGLDPELEIIQGIFVLNQKETPGLGNYITDGTRFRNQFGGLRIDPPIVVVKSSPDPEHEILALTGATISSASVSEIINQTVANLRQPILSAGTGLGDGPQGVGARGVGARGDGTRGDGTSQNVSGDNVSEGNVFEGQAPEDRKGE